MKLLCWHPNHIFSDCECGGILVVKSNCFWIFPRIVEVTIRDKMRGARECMLKIKNKTSWDLRNWPVPPINSRWRLLLTSIKNHQNHSSWTHGHINTLYPTKHPHVAWFVSFMALPSFSPAWFATIHALAFWEAPRDNCCNKHCIHKM